MTVRRFITITVLAAVAAFALHFVQHSAASAAKSAAFKPPLAPSAVIRSTRPNYPYSVVAGGVYSTDELRKATESDPVARSHYEDFRLDQARLVQNQEDRLVYVSYRMNNIIFWTHKRLRIPKGEMLITDGANFCRTRCGNRLSVKARPEISESEPEERILNLADLPVNDVPVNGGPSRLLALSQAPPLSDLVLASHLPFEDNRLKAIWPQTSASSIPPPSVWSNADLPVPHTVLAPLPLVVLPSAPSSGTSSSGTSAPPVTVPPSGPDTPAAVPEPATATLFLGGLGLGVAFVVARRKSLSAYIR